LTECGLINIRVEGRERYCEVKLDKLKQVSEWIDQYKLFWTTKLDALELHLAKQDKTNKKRNNKK
jgi:hypothetical protein